MKTTVIDNSIRVITVRATSFPDGIQDAFERMHRMLPFSRHRQNYGISYSDADGNITYEAACAAEYEGESSAFGLEEFVIPAGTYIMETIEDWEKHIEEVREVFQRLLADPRIDPQGFCLEVYHGTEKVDCMVRIIPGG
jgi:predicted transcriptional regulator YdeE